MDQRDVSQRFCVAARLRRLQRQRFSDGDVVKYIENQRAHHAKRSYQEEFLGLLKNYGIAYDLAHVLG